MKNQSRFWRYLFLILAITIVSGVSYVMAAEVWVGPGTNPPEGNRSRPVDVSEEFQTKAGGFRIQNDFIVGLGTGAGVMPAKGLDSFWILPTESGSSFGLIGPMQIQGATGGIIDISGENGISILMQDGADSSDSAIIAQNDGLGWSGYFSGAPVGIGNYLIVGAVPVGAVPAIGNGYFSGDVYIGSGENKLCLNGSAEENCITSFEDIGAGGDLWQLSVNGSSIYYNDGFVGVGTTTPSQKLEVVWNDNLGGGQGVARIRVTDLDTGDNPEIQWQYGYADNDHWSFYANESDESFRLWSPFDGGDDRLTVNKYGSFGIGTIYPKAKLDVLGLFKAQQIVTDQFKVNDVKYGSFGGSLWVGKNLGNIAVCSSISDDCDNVADLAGDAHIVSTTVFNGRLFLGMSDGHLMSCDSKPTCVDLGMPFGGSAINDIAVFNNRLWLAMSSVNQIYSCDASGSCSAYNTGADASYITALTPYNGRLWLISENQLFSCSTAGVCQNEGSNGLQAFLSMTVFDGNLWLGNGSGKPWKCLSDGSCIEMANNVGGAINKMVVFSDKLWTGQSNGKISYCDTYGNCTTINQGIPSGNVKSMAVFNGYLWVGMAGGKLAYCTAQGNCVAEFDLTDSVNSLVVYDYPARSCVAFSKAYDECIGSPLAVEADFVRPVSMPNTGKCMNGSVLIKKTDCGLKVPDDPLSQDNYCGLKCPAGTTFATGGCSTLGDYRSISGQQLRYFFNSSNPLEFSAGSYDFGWECQVTEGHVLEVWVLCQGTIFRSGTYNESLTNPCP